MRISTNTSMRGNGTLPYSSPLFDNCTYPADREYIPISLKIEDAVKRAPPFYGECFDPLKDIFYITAIIAKNTDGSVNVQRTNASRIQAVKDNNLAPFFVFRHVDFYRIVQRGDNGILDIYYDRVMPRKIYELDDLETIPLQVAALYLGIDIPKISKMMDEILIRKKDSCVYLKDVNEIKFRSTVLKPRKKLMQQP